MEERINAPAVVTNNVLGNTGVPTAHEMMAYQTYAKMAVDSQMYRGIGKDAGVMMIMLAAREYGLGPAQALNGGINIIEGKVELSARVMGGMIRRSKHTLKILETTDQQCKIYGRRNDTGEEYTAVYTIQQAQNAGLVKEKGAWKKNPSDMLYARALSTLARRLFQDVIGIGYVQGEISMDSFTEDIPPEIQDNDAKLLEEQLYEIVIDKQDLSLMVQFVEYIQSKYKLTYVDTLKELVKDINKTLTKFQEWKSFKVIL